MPTDYSNKLRYLAAKIPIDANIINDARMTGCSNMGSKAPLLTSFILLITASASVLQENQSLFCRRNIFNQLQQPAIV